MNFNLFPAFFDNPEKMAYAQQEADEHIELLLRQHWFTNVGWITVAVLGLIFPFFFAIIDNQFIKILPQIPPEITVAVTILWYMLMTAYILEHYLYWYFNIYIVTNLHLIDVAMNSLLSKTATEIFLKDVESAKTKVAGIFGSLFNYGDVIIETAAERQNIQFLRIPSPDVVAERIQDLQELVNPGGGNDGP